MSSRLEQLPDLYSLISISQVAFFFHPIDKNLSLGTPGKSHFRPIVSVYRNWETAIPAG